MLDKHRILAITKSDLLDEELIGMLREELPQDLPVVFISAVTGKGVDNLKDLLWEELNSESNKLQAISEGGTIIHRNRDTNLLANDFADWQDEELEKYSDGEEDDWDDYDIEFLDNE